LAGVKPHYFTGSIIYTQTADYSLTYTEVFVDSFLCLTGTPSVTVIIWTFLKQKYDNYGW